MAVFRCNVCNVYEYNQEKGDHKTGIEPGTHPSDFPDNWACPICTSDKTHLDPL